MAESPSKRQRISVDAYKAIGSVSEVEDNGLPKPTTPVRRQSYLSPTKASLARSHPDVLAKSPRRGSRTEPRGRLLREELLGSRKSTDKSTSTSKSVQKPFLETQDAQHSATNQVEKDELARAITRSFSALEETHKEGRTQLKANVRSPLRTRQPPNEVMEKHGEEHQTESSVSNNIPIPKLVKSQTAPARQRSEARNEPILPPTPVQLGMGSVPDRPRGLASSSSAGSKSGSGRHRRRVREGAMSITSSPLKPRNTRPISPTDFSDVDEIVEKQPVEEAPESDAEGDIVENQTLRKQLTQEQESETFPDDHRERQKELSDLQSELNSLRAVIAKTESLVDQMQQVSDVEIDDKLKEILDLDLRPMGTNSQSSETHTSFLKNPVAYLTLFAPGKLQLEHATTTKRIQERAKLVHKLTLVSAQSWSHRVLSLSFDVEVDAEDARIDKVVLEQPAQKRKYGSLLKWVEARLESPLHHFDISGIVWGVGHYFDACVKRAEALKDLDQRYNENAPANFASQANDALKPKISDQLTPYLFRSQLVLTAPDQYLQGRTKSKGSFMHARQIMLTYEIDLTWTGNATVQLDISLTGINAATQKDVKELFGKLLPTQGLEKAFDSVWNILRWERAQNENASSTKSAARSWR